MLNRRELLKASTGLLVASSGAWAAERPGPKKAVMWSMLPGGLAPADRIKLAKAVGFDGIEMPPIADAAECAALRKAAEQAEVRLHSVIYGGWDPPLTHPDPAQRERSRANAEAALQSAARLGADDILLVPGVVNADTSYRDAWKHSQEGIRALIPTASKLKILICVEEVWNNFLLSPIEFAAYIDSFQSPWVQAYFDIGNVVTFGWPEDWIHTLGKRIRKVHLKDYKGGPGLFGGNKGSFVNLRDGSVNWPVVRKALDEIGFTDFMTTELGGGDEAYLRDVSRRVDLILAGQ
jgi:L-ribulose-5-phosphate 3-epimerase